MPSSSLGFSPQSPRDHVPSQPAKLLPLGFSPLGSTTPMESTSEHSVENVPREYTAQNLFPQEVALMVTEVFAGTARLSQACQAVGFRTLAVDKSSQRSRFAIHHLALTQPADVQALLDIITLEADNLDLVHLAPPCGTSSAARNKPIPQAVQHGKPVPQPLRSPTEPQGLSTLAAVDLDRVQQANALYQTVGVIARHCIALGVRVSVENPLNSLAWLCDGMDDCSAWRWVPNVSLTTAAMVALATRPLCGGVRTTLSCLSPFVAPKTMPMNLGSRFSVMAAGIIPLPRRLLTLGSCVSELLLFCLMPRSG